MKNRYCSECGTAYETTWPTDELVWPRRCPNCHVERWLNASSVSVVMQPVIETPSGETGLVIAKRAIEPAKGMWALIGGFVAPGESIEQGAYREFREETGLALASMPQIVSNEPVGVTEAPKLLFMTYVDKAMPYEVFLQGKPCHENDELGLLFASSTIELAFPTHRAAAAQFFDGVYGDDILKGH